MNNNYFPNNPYMPQYDVPQSTAPPITDFTNSALTEYVQQLLKDSTNKYARIYMSFPDSVEWRDKIFEGTIVSTGKDYIIIKNKNMDEWSVLWTIYVNYVVFTEDITN